MTLKEAQTVAQQLGDIALTDAKLQAEIQRLNRKSFVPLEQVKILHDWLERKRQARQSGRVVGESQERVKQWLVMPTGSDINPSKNPDNRQLCLLLIFKFRKSVVLRNCLE